MCDPPVQRTYPLVVSHAERVHTTVPFSALLLEWKRSLIGKDLRLCRLRVV